MRFLNAFFALLLAPSLVSANELLRVYDLAVQNDTQLRAAAGARDAGLEATRQTGGALLPQVTARGDISDDEFTRKNIPRTVCVNSGGKTDNGDCVFTSEPYNVVLSVTQWVFNKELWSRWRQAGDRAALAEATYRTAEQALALRVTEAYFNVLGAADNVRFADAEKKAVERSLELAKKRFEVGLSAITDVQQTQARYDLVVAQQIEAEQALANAQEALTEITGSRLMDLQSLREDIPLLGPSPDSVADWLKAAHESNLSLLSARLQTEIAERDVGISAAGHYPVLGLNGQQVLGNSSGFNSGEFEDRRATLQLTVPLFAGGTTQANVRASRAILEQRRAEQEGARRQVERNVKNAYQGVITGVARVKALKQAVVSNITALEAAEVGLEVGARTAVDVLDAQRELYRAQRDYARARYDYLLNVLRLKSAAGQLSGKDLNEIDSLLVNERASEFAG